MIYTHVLNRGGSGVQSRADVLSTLQPSDMVIDGQHPTVYRVREGTIDRVWFYNEPSDAEALSAVFALS